MLKRLAQNEILRTGQLGGFCPFWTQDQDGVIIADTAEEILQAPPPEKRVIEPAAVLTLLQFNYILGNRTLVKGVYRMP